MEKKQRGPGRPKELHTCLFRYSKDEDGRLYMRKSLQVYSTEGFDSYLRPWADEKKVRLESFHFEDQLLEKIILLAAQAAIGNQSFTQIATAIMAELKGKVKKNLAKVAVAILLDMSILCTLFLISLLNFY